MLSAQQTTIRVLTYNVQMLPESLKKIKQQKRAEAIIQAIDSLDYDVIFFQEIFDKKQCHFFWNALKSKFPYRQKDEKKYFLKVNNGLMIWSKFPLQSQSNITFQKATQWDKWSKKGAIFALTIINNDSILLVNTHLQSDYNKQNHEIRTAQLVQIKNHIEKHYNTSNSIVAGDFNIDILKDNEALDSILIQPFQLKIGDYYHNEKITRTPVNKWVEANAPKTSYDLILANFIKEFVHNTRKIKYFRKNIDNIVYDLSDHYALEAVFIF